MSLLRSSRLWPYSVAVLIVVLTALCAYAYYRHSRIKSLVEDLKSDRPEVARAAAGSLGEIGSDIVPYLIPTIKDMNAQARVYAAMALRDIDSAVPSLVKLLNGKDVEMRAAAVEILGNMGSAAQDAVPALIEVLKDEDAGVRKMANVALGEIKDPRAIGPLIESIRRKSVATGVAEESLLKIGRDAIPALITALKNDASGVKESSARVLGRMGPAAKGAVPDLIEALKDKDAGVRRTVIPALGELKDPRAIEPLIETFYRDSSPDNPAPAALGKIGSEAIPPLIEKLKERKDTISVFSISALGEIGPEARVAVQPLIALLKDKSPAVRGKAVWALGRIKDKAAVPPLMEMLKQKPPAEGVIEALGEIGPDAKEAVPFLIEMFGVEELHNDAAAAWKKISPESMNEIMYLEQKYANMEDAISGIELLEPTTKEILLWESGYPKTLVVKFEWKLLDAKDGVKFCSAFFIDKGVNPFDDWAATPVYARHATQLEVPLAYGEYHLAPFEWGVKVIACYDSGASCDKRGLCTGRTFSKVGKHTIVD